MDWLLQLLSGAPAPNADPTGVNPLDGNIKGQVAANEVARGRAEGGAFGTAAHMYTDPRTIKYQNDMVNRQLQEAVMQQLRTR